MNEINKEQARELAFKFKNSQYIDDLLSFARKVVFDNIEKEAKRGNYYLEIRTSSLYKGIQDLSNINAMIDRLYEILHEKGFTVRIKQTSILISWDC